MKNLEIERPNFVQAQLIINNSIKVPYSAWTNIAGNYQKIRLWEAMQENCGGRMNNHSCVPINYDEYYSNYFILAFDLTQNQDNGFTPNEIEKGQLEINLKTDNDQETRTMVAIVMMSFDSVLNFEGDTATLSPA